MDQKKKSERAELQKKVVESLAKRAEKLDIELRERFIFLLHVSVFYEEGSRRYKVLERRYGISSRRWQNVCNRAQMPGIDMICSLLDTHPEYTTWLMLGRADNREQFDALTYDSLDTSKYGKLNLYEEGWEERLRQIYLALIESDSIRPRRD